MPIIFFSQIFPSTKICSEKPACSVIQTCFVTIGHQSSIPDDTHNAWVSNAKYRGQLGVAIGQEQVRVLPVGRTSNSPEAVHAHLKDQSQWSHQTTYSSPHCSASVQACNLGTDHYFSGGGGDEKLSSAKFFLTYVSANIYFLSSFSCKQFFSICFECSFFCAKCCHCLFTPFFEEPNHYYYSHFILCRYTLHSPVLIFDSY